MLKKFSILAAAAAVLAFAAPAHAQELLTNPGFETGDLTGWTDAGNLGWNSVVGGGHSGSFQISNGAVGSPSILKQTVATTAGAMYDISGWFASSGAGEFGIVWDGNFLVPFALRAAGGYVQYGGSAAASTNSTTVEFWFRDNPSFSQFDDASVKGSVPEPGSIALFAAGSMGMGMLLIRRGRK